MGIPAATSWRRNGEEPRGLIRQRSVTGRSQLFISFETWSWSYSFICDVGGPQQQRWPRAQYYIRFFFFFTTEKRWGDGEGQGRHHMSHSGHPHADISQVKRDDIKSFLNLTWSSSLQRRSSSSDIRFSCFLKYLRLAACRLNHVYEKDLTWGSSASMNGWNSSCGEIRRHYFIIINIKDYLLHYHIFKTIRAVFTGDPDKKICQKLTLFFFFF